MDDGRVLKIWQYSIACGALSHSMRVVSAIFSTLTYILITDEEPTFPCTDVHAIILIPRPRTQSYDNMFMSECNNRINSFRRISIDPRKALK